MRRGELLKLPELKVTETMRKTVREDQGDQVLRCGRDRCIYKRYDPE